MEKSNVEIIATIRQEIERRITDNTFGAKLELIDILAYLDTLSVDAPEGLDEAAVDGADTLLAKPKDYALAAKADYWNGAHDGFKAGAEWRDAQLPKLPKELDDAAEEYSKQASDGHNFRDLICGFKAGAEWAFGQGVTVNGIITKIREDCYLDIDGDQEQMLSVFDNEEEVIVQIRKK